MSQNEYETCDACGVSAEMGFVIKEGDDVAEVTIFAENKQDVEAAFQPYLALAQSINQNVVHDLRSENIENSNPCTIKLKFECSAEKLIFELRSRSLNKQ